MNDDFEEKFKHIVSSNNLEDDDQHKEVMPLQELAHICEQIGMTSWITTKVLNSSIEMSGEYEMPPLGAGLLRALHYLCEEYCAYVVDFNEEEEVEDIEEEEEEEGGSED